MFANETRLGAPGISDVKLEAAETLVARETAKMRPSGTLNWLQPRQRRTVHRRCAAPAVGARHRGTVRHRGRCTETDTQGLIANTAVKGAMAPTILGPLRGHAERGQRNVAV
ncbi:hypothetical protein GCM10027174_20370 [Salinifilum aidingensis]